MISAPAVVAAWLFATGSPCLADPPVASDFDLNSVPVNTVVIVKADDIVSSFATDVDEQLVATALDFGGAIIDGSPVASPAEAGFSYTPGAGSGGEFTVDPTVAAFAGLTPGTSAAVEVSFTASDSGLETDTGVLHYTVTGDPGSYDELAFHFQGPPTTGVTAERTAGASESLASIVVTGAGTLSSALAGFDFSAIDAPAAAPGAEVAIAIAADEATADAAAENGSVARAAAENGSVARAEAGSDSGASAFAVDHSTATATARDDGGASSSSSGDSSSTSFASAGGDAIATSRDGSIAQAVANFDSVATASAQNGSDSLAFASSASLAGAIASDESSATCSSENGSLANSLATLAGTVLASATDMSIASATSSNGFLATSEASDGGKAGVSAAAPVANPQIDDNGPDSADLRLPAQVNAANDTPNALFFEVAGAGGAVERVVLSGFPAGSTMSAGMEVSPGVWAFTGPPPLDLTFSLPAGWTDSFELEVRVEIANSLGAIETSLLVNLGLIFSDGFEDRVRGDRAE